MLRDIPSIAGCSRAVFVRVSQPSVLGDRRREWRDRGRARSHA